ncbi:sulfite exporter TauE/SafE family protein [Pararhodospirillum oryzae]|uniref:Probable membrane transporter protein n=1 Tax=Pararhodospirillum oryzae TaxID=478448 RepID=A0A512H636_9PROT|nr:sulfite exporter TauE/SafE family protein [Pararhodospirillum oryzae]GEO80939.1 membrane protein [Pararhodospirillum oryzae]
MWLGVGPATLRPMMDHTLLLGLCLVVFLAAGVVKGLLGMGLPTVAMGLLGLVLSPAEAAALMLVPSLLTNLWQALAGPSPWPLLRRLAPLLAGITFGTALGAPWMHAETTLVRAGLGGILVVYALVGLGGVRLPRVRATRGPVPIAVGLVMGLLTGLASGATGVFVLPSVPYLASLSLDRPRLVQALGLAFTTASAALALALAAHDRLPFASLGWSTLAVVPAVAGMAAGAWLGARVPQALFRRLFYGGLLVLGGEIMLKSLGG